jgi:integrase
MGRDPQVRIADILALPNPISVIMDMLNIMLRDVEVFSDGPQKAIFFRDILLIALLIGNPLRISMFCMMKFDRNLIREEDGSWWIYFNREDFKNRKSISSDYYVRVAPELIPLIERYKREFRPLLFGAEESDYVFLRGYANTKRKPALNKQERLDKLTLELLADKQLVESYVTGFMKGRSFNKYNHAHINFLSQCNSLLRPKTGYLYQHPEFALKIGLSGDVNEWQEKCADTRNRLLKIQLDRRAKKSKRLKYKSKSNVRDQYSLSRNTLSERISIRVLEYLDLPHGFFAHAFRHIVATNIIKSTPETGFFLASKVLHDKLETVEDNYAHLKTHEFFEPYNRFISGFFSKIIDTDGSGISTDENGGGGK